MNAEEKALRSVIETLIQGLQSNDMRLVEQAYSHDRNLLVFLEGPKMKLVGWKAMKEAVSSFLRSHTQIQSRLNKDSRFIADGQLGIFYGTYRFKAINKNTGKPVRWTARNTFVFRKIGGRWRVIHEHDSFPAPMPGA